MVTARRQTVAPGFLVSKVSVIFSSVGIRVPDHPIALGLVGLLGHPIITTTAALPDEAVESDPYEIEIKFGPHLALVIDGGIVLPEPSSIISMIDDAPEIIREGKGDVSGFA